MNYNRGCYRQPSASNYCKPDRIHEQLPIQPRYTESGQYNTANTMEMNYKLAMVYSPYQEWQNIYCGDKALECGTIFAELDKPFLGYKCNKGGCSL